jgi:type II secretory pathway component GspD/PulD (secretin)
MSAEMDFMCGLAAAAWLALAQGMPVARLAGEAGGQAVPAVPGPQTPGLPVTRIDPGGAALDSPRRLSLAFAEPQPIHDVLTLLLDGTPFSVVIDAGVEGTFRGELKQLTLRDALAAILDPLGLDFDVNGTLIRVMRDRVEMRQFDLNLIAVQRGLARTAGGAGAMLSSTVPAEDVFAAIADGVRALLSRDGSAHVDRRAGFVQVSDHAERLDRVALYLEALQVRSTRQVRLEARVYEVTLTNAPALDWRVVRAKLGIPQDVPRAGLAADPSTLQAALADQGEVRVIAAPELTALNNEPVLVRAGTAGASSITMTVVPQIGADGMVQLSVSQAWEEHGPARSVHAAEADTVTRVASGSTVLIAGLLRPPQTLPPGGGALFRSGTNKRTPPSELVVLLRASVVTP